MFVVLNWVVALSRHDEIGGNELRALMKELVEGVLGIGGGLSKQNRAGGVLYILAVAGNCLSVGLHRQLLEVGGEPMEVLIESEHG